MQEDIKMMKNTGFDAYRFSISWPRVLPGGKLSLGVNREGIEYYNDVINTLLDNDIEPYVTLFHWDPPFTLEQKYGGFLSKQVVNDFRDFAELCFWEFGDRVKYWITLNEPWTYSVHGYVGCIFPPGKPGPFDGKVPFSDSDSDSESTPKMKGLTTLTSLEKIGENLFSSRPPKEAGYNFIPYRGFSRMETDFDLINYGDATLQTMSLISDIDNQFVSDYKTNLAKDVYIVARNMLLAHATAVHSYRTKFQGHQKGKIGITLVSHWFEPYNEKDDKDQKAAKRALHFMLGWFLEPVLIVRYPQNMKDFVHPKNLETFSDEESNLLKGSIDFLGLNYYTTYYAKDDPIPTVAMGYNKDQQLKTHRRRGFKRIGQRSGAKWLYIVPQGIYLLLKYIEDTYNNNTYKLPDIYITENGVADKKDHKLTPYEACRDQMRVDYYREHIGNVLNAINQGLTKVKGYFAWSWCDNFEWADGYTCRFGIIYIDYVNNLKRYPKDSAMWFAKFLVKKEKQEKKQLVNYKM